jgi:hypothetical protein
VCTGELDGLAELGFVVAYGVRSDRDLAQVVGLLGVHGVGVEVIGQLLEASGGRAAMAGDLSSRTR